MQTLPQRIKRTIKQSGFIVGLVRAARAGTVDLKQLRCLAARPHQIASYLATHPVRKLQLGTSHNPLDGWFNTDVVPESAEVTYLDATRTFPFADNVFDYIACEHMIEHIDHPSALIMLRESFRVLKPGGRIRIATPNLRALIGLCAPELTEAQKKYVDWIAKKLEPEPLDCRAVFVLNNAFRAWGHQFLYDPETLAATMTLNGFTDLKNYPPGVSDDPNLRGIEAHGREIGNEEINAFETFILEGRVPLDKPAGKIK
jgi:predicted SAM-dependent methyltransferase